MLRLAVVPSPELRPDNVDIFGTMSRNEGPEVSGLIDATGDGSATSRLIDLTSTSIESPLTMLYAFLRQSAKKAVDGLCLAIGQMIPTSDRTDCGSYLSVVCVDTI